MNILIDVGHPADVHFFKNIAKNLTKDGHTIKITARNKDVLLNLLQAYDLEYENVGGYGKTISKKLFIYVNKFYKLYTIAKKFKPDILIGFANPFVAQLGRLIQKPSINFTDTEHAKLANTLTFYFANIICTPECYRGKVPSQKHVTFNGYKELAYLHPDYFKPDPTILDDINLDKKEKFIVLRFVAWKASHDVGQHGITNKEELVRELERLGRIIIISENELNEKLEKYRINISPERIHDLLYYASLYLGEGATMASECAVLGTPAIYVNTLRLGYTDEEEERYGLVYNFSEPKTAQKQAIIKAIELLEHENLKKKWLERRDKLLCEKIDVTKFITKYIENYPIKMELSAK